MRVLLLLRLWMGSLAALLGAAGGPLVGPPAVLEVLVALVVGPRRRVVGVRGPPRERAGQPAEAVVLPRLVGDAQERARHGLVAELLGALVAEVGGHDLAPDLREALLGVGPAVGQEALRPADHV